MASLTQNGSQFGRQGDPNAILNEVRDIDNGITQIEVTLEELKALQQQSLADSDTSPGSKTNTELQRKTNEIFAMYKNLVAKLTIIKQKPESGSPRNAPQVGKVDRRLKNAFQNYREEENKFEKKLRAQAERQYRMVNPDASEEEVDEVVNDPLGNQRVFANALLKSNRRGEVTAVETAVKNRHAAIQKIERDIAQIAEMFQDMDNLVVQQEAAVVNIEQKGEEVVENMDKGTEQIGVAIKSARNRNKLKWWCLGITSTYHSLSFFTHTVLTFTSHSPNHHHHCCRRRSSPFRQPNHRQNYNQAFRPS
jgi:syntaxin 1B/2/3